MQNGALSQLRSGPCRYTSSTPVLLAPCTCRAVTRRRLLGMSPALPLLSAFRRLDQRMKTYAGPVSDHFDGVRFLRSRRRAAEDAGRGAALAMVGGRDSAKWPELGAERRLPIRRRRASRREGAAVLRRPCQLADPDRGPQHPGRSGLVGARLAVRLRRARSASTIPASPSTRCRRSTSCWCRTATTIISTLATLSKLAAKFSPRVVTPLGNDITMREADAAIRAEAFDWNRSRRTRQRRRGDAGADAALDGARRCSTATRRCGRASCSRRRPGKIYIVCDSGYGSGSAFPPRRASARPAAARDPADRRL